MRNTGGWSIQPTSARVEADGTAVIDAKVQGPPPGGIVTQAITYPYAVIVVIQPRREEGALAGVKRRKPVRAELLKERLDQLVATFDVSTIEPDPLQLVLRYDDPLDQEVAGLIAAAFAYGRADIIVANIGVVLARMKPSPYRYLHDVRRARSHATIRRLRASLPQDAGPRRVSRDARERDRRARIARRALQEVLRRRATRTSDHSASCAVHPTSRGLAGGATRLAPRRPRSRSACQLLRYLLTYPADGSACKRMNLYPPLDGPPHAARPRPLDVRRSGEAGHAARHAHPPHRHVPRPQRPQVRRLESRARAHRRLARFDAADPVRYDFALCRLGILDLCSRKQRKENCDVCLLRDVCRFPVM